MHYFSTRRAADATCNSSDHSAPQPTPYWVPHNDVFVSPAGEFELDLCGLQRGDFEIITDRHKLRVKGERRREDVAAALGLMVTEISAGPFETVFEVPSEFDLAQKRFSYSEGVLRISVPPDSSKQNPTLV